MSQHFFETQYNGKKVKVFAGWDRPLQGFFMMVEDLDASEGSDDPYIYNNLARKDSHPKTFEPFIHVLVDLGIIIPKEMIDEIVADGIANMGNKVVRHYQGNGKHAREQLYISSL